MEILALAIYSAIVWFIFIKKKWLPWNIATQVTVVIIPIVALSATILLLNVVAPSTADVRVIKYVINVVPQVRGRVIEVPVEPNRLVKKGRRAVPHRSDAVRARRARARGATRRHEGLVARARRAGAGRPGQDHGGARRDRAGGRQGARGAGEARPRARACRPEPRARLDRRGRPLLARAGRSGRQESRGADRHRARVRGAGACRRGAGACQRTATQGAHRRPVRRRVRAGRADSRAARERQVGARADDGVRPGRRLRDQRAIASGLFHDRLPDHAGDDLRRAGPPGRGALRAERTAPGRARQRSRIHAQRLPRPNHQGDGRLDRLGAGARPGAQQHATADDGLRPDAARAVPGEAHGRPQGRRLFLPAGAVGHGAIYTEHGAAIHIIRKVILRVGAKLDYLVLKLH